MPSATVFCCKTDLCNAYTNEFKQEYVERDRGYPILTGGAPYAYGNDHAPELPPYMFENVLQNRYSGSSYAHN